MSWALSLRGRTGRAAAGPGRARASQTLSRPSRPRPSVPHARSRGAAEPSPCQAGGLRRVPGARAAAREVAACKGVPCFPRRSAAPPPRLAEDERGWRGGLPTAASRPRLPGGCAGHVTGPGQRDPTLGRSGSQALSQPRASCSGRVGRQAL